MSESWRLILEPKSDGYYNMAADDAILNNYSSSKIPTLRIYGWDRPFISLGYNQNPQKTLTSSNSLPFVRRVTGGGAILHHQEITYSLVCSVKDLSLPNSVKGTYWVICSFLLDFYKNLGLDADFAKNIFANQLDEHSHFCFSNFSSTDLIVNGKKIGGNAQRRRRDVIFQHGSIPWEIDFEAVVKSIRGSLGSHQKATFLKELLKKDISFFEFGEYLARSFCKVFKVNLIRSYFSEPEKKSIKRLLDERYLTKNWNLYKLLQE